MSDVRSMTYAEIAVAFGISPDSARNLVRRKRWARKPGNDGLARIGVPMEHLERVARTTSPPTAGPIEGSTGAPTSGTVGGATSDLALSVLMQHVKRCEAEIEALNQKLDAACKQASERDIIAAHLAALDVALSEVRSERNYWRDHAERLSLALMPPAQRSRWPWRGLGFFRGGLIKAPDAAEADQITRSAREAARDAGLLPSVIGTPISAENIQPGATPPAPAITSRLDKDGPPLSASDLERALELLNKEIDDAQAVGAQLAA